MSFVMPFWEKADGQVPPDIVSRTEMKTFSLQGKARIAVEPILKADQAQNSAK